MKRIGKIHSISFGMGGYDDAMIGVSVTLSGDGWACGDFRGTWAVRPASAKWTEESQKMFLGGAVLWLRDLLNESKKKNLADLLHVPIEATFEGPNGKLISWRILTEVL